MRIMKAFALIAGLLTAPQAIAAYGGVTLGQDQTTPTATPVCVMYGTTCKAQIGTYNGSTGVWTLPSGFNLPGVGPLGAGVGPALGVNVGTVGAFVVNGGALGTPSSGTLTNATGLPVGGIAAIGANTIVGNGTAGSATPTALTALPSTFTGTSGHVLPYLDTANTASAQWSFNGGIAATQALSGTYSADYYSNPIVLNFGAVSNTGHNNYGLGPTCNVNSASYSGQLFCAYSHVDAQAIPPGLNQPNNAFVGNFSYATGSGNITSTDAGMFGGNDNVIVIGTGWDYIVGREIDVTTYQPVKNKDGLRIAQGSVDAYQGSVTDGAIHVVKLPGGIGWKNIIYLDAVNGGVLSTSGCIICAEHAATITTGIDISAWTVTGYQWKSTGLTIDGGGSINLTGSSANHSPITFTDTNTGGQTWVMGPGVGVGTAGSFNIYDSTNLTTLFKLTSAGDVIVTGDISSGATKYVQSGAVAVASLPACAAGTKGARIYVTDSNAALTAGIGAIVAAGGANNVPVGCDGTNWRIGG